MNPLTGLFGALRSQIASIGDALTRDDDGQRGLHEQIQRVGEHLKEWRGLLDTLKAQAFAAQARIDTLDAKIALREAQAIAALEAGHDGLAREVAEAIAALLDERALEPLNLEAGTTRRVQIEALVEHGENTLRRLRHQVDLLRAAQAVARGEESLRSHGASPLGIPTAIDSAERLRSRRAAEAEPRPDAAPQRDMPDDLDARLAQAGVAGPSPVDLILARLAQRIAPTTPKRRTRTSARKDTP